MLTSRQFDDLVGAQVFFKAENFQRSGSFKFRGAFNAISALSETDRKRGIITFSSGNHAQAIALAAREIGIPAIVVMPQDAPATKREATMAYGATIVPYDRLLEDREVIAQDYVSRDGLTLVPPYNHLEVLSGQGTAAFEFIEEVGTLDVLFCCVGGGGLISGTAIATRHLLPQCTIIGIEPEAGNDAQQSLLANRIISIAAPQTIADGARTLALGSLTFPLIRQLVQQILTVTDSELLTQMRFFAERMKIIVEPTGALSAAGVLKYREMLQKKRVGVIISGGNVDL